MAYVSVPKDLTRVKNKVAFNLTRRQIICFGAAGLIGIPFYILTRDVIGNSSAMMGMVVLMIPAFLFAMYEKDGMPLEKVLMNMITVKFRRPQIRVYETDNLYERPEILPAAGKSRKRKKGNTSRKWKAVPGNGNYGRNMDSRNPVGWTEADLSRRNAAAALHTASQKGGKIRARQG